MYQPAEDSLLLVEELKKNLTGKEKKMGILDMGSGSGIISETCISLGFTNLVAADIDKETLKFLKNKFKKRIKIKESNLFSNIKEKFDLITFNPPYLPEDKFDKEKDTSAGKKGNEIILKFLKNAKSHLNRDGEILLLFSSFSKPKEIIIEAKKIYKIKLLASENLFFEKLFVYSFR
jgi:release factor glutamine methyltransferase